MTKQNYLSRFFSVAAVPGLTLTTPSQEDESSPALSSSKQPVSKNFIEILRFLNGLYPTQLNTDENPYDYDEDQLNSALCSSIVSTCLGTCETSFNDESVESLINTIRTAANVNGNRDSKPERAENDGKDRDEVSVCDKEVDREENKEWKENEEIYLKTSIPLEQTDESSSSSSSSVSTTSSSNTSSSNTSSTTRTNTTISYSISTTDVSALPASPVCSAPPLPPVYSGPSNEFGLPRLKTITLDDLQKNPVKSKLVQKRRYIRKTSQLLKPKPLRECRGPEAIIREVGDVRTISYNHFVPPPSRSPNAVKRSNLSDSSYSTFSDAKRFAQTQIKGVFGKGFGENFPIVIKSPQLSDSSSSSSESGRD
ncbi:uncharacterized protein DDB_G0271670 isoform X2 [Cephus cinctus]|uniref:Uncharacterized protein DDB_G0271670 isoform X2 n=1 Tax=Cephus cinctus TaxID=211228 RepID=A0AAJ7RH11_CEPCN|nr:uncharacterized protein DDB_G0271670 isoform X2 [Cephus cinctus]